MRARKAWIALLLCACAASLVLYGLSRERGGTVLPAETPRADERPAQPAELARFQSESREPSPGSSPSSENPPAASLPPHELHTTEIHGIVTDLEGAPQPLAHVRFTYFLVTEANGLSRSRPSRFQTECNERGEFSLPVPRAGGSLEATGPAITTVKAPTVDVPADPDVNYTIVVAPAFALSGTVVDERDLPVANALVHLALSEDARATDWSVALRIAESLTARSTDDGTFWMGGCPLAESSRVEVSADGFLPGSWPAPAGEGPLVLRLERDPNSALVCGTVLDESGMPAFGALVSVGALVVEADSEGRFCLDLHSPWMARLTPGAPVELVAMKDEAISERVRVPALDADRAASWPLPLELRLVARRSFLGGRVVDSKGVPVPGLSVRLRDPTRLGFRELVPGSGEFVELISESLGGRTDGSTSTGADGRFRLAGLEARSYTLEVRDRRSLARVLAGPFLADSNDITIHFDPPLQALAGVVVNAAGDPVPDVRLAATFDAGPFGLQFGAATRSAADGRFQLGPLGIEEVFLRVEGDDILPMLFWEVPASGLEALTIVVSRRCGFRVDWASTDPRTTTVCVYDASGKPLKLTVLDDVSVGVNDGIARPSEEVVLVPEAAAYAVALRGDEELGRVPLRPLPDSVQVIEF